MDVVLIIGQSNAVGRGLGPYEENSYWEQGRERLFQLGRFDEDNLRVIPLTEPMQHWLQEPSRLSGNDFDRISFATSFGLRYVSRISRDRNLLFIPAAYGSSSIFRWNKQADEFICSGDQAQGDVLNAYPAMAEDTISEISEYCREDTTELYDNALRRVDRALSAGERANIVAIIWQQGETDIWASYNRHHLLNVFYQEKQDIYKEQLISLINDIRTDIGNIADVAEPQCIPFLIGEPVATWIPSRDTSLEEEGKRAKAKFIDLLYEVADESDLCNVKVIKAGWMKSNEVDFADWPLELQNQYYEDAYADDVHYSAESQRLLGHEYFKALRDLRYAKPSVRDNPVIVIE